MYVQYNTSLQHYQFVHVDTEKNAGRV